MILPIFTDVSGLKIAINPDNVLSVANAGREIHRHQLCRQRYKS